MSNIIPCGSLLEFKGNRRMQVGAFVNSKTGDSFHSCVFTDNNGKRELVAFSSHLGELSPKQIAAMKNDLQVVMMPSGNKILCKKGENTWEDVDI